MGCDIHLAVEVRRGGKWQREAIVPEQFRDPWFVEQAAKNPGSFYEKWAERQWYHDRNYEVFAVLADVRNNGHITPISEPRGLPDDMDEATRRLHYEYRGEDDGGEDDIDLGDHSFSWLTLAELQAYPWDSVVQRDGVVSLEQFMERVLKHGSSVPVHVERFPYKEWSGGITGPGIVVREADEIVGALDKGGFAAAAGERTYVSDSWVMPVRIQARAFTERFLPALATLGGPDDVRIVFGFDS